MSFDLVGCLARPVGGLGVFLVVFVIGVNNPRVEDDVLEKTDGSEAYLFSLDGLTTGALKFGNLVGVHDDAHQTLAASALGLQL